MLKKDQRQSAREISEVIFDREQTELEDDWRKIVNISNKFADLRQEVSDMLAELEHVFGHDTERLKPH